MTSDEAWGTPQFDRTSPYQSLTALAEVFQASMSEKKSAGDLIDFVVEPIYDDLRLDVTVIFIPVVKPLKNIKVTLKLGRSL